MEKVRSVVRNRECRGKLVSSHWSSTNLVYMSSSTTLCQQRTQTRYPKGKGSIERSATWDPVTEFRK